MIKEQLTNILILIILLTIGLFINTIFFQKDPICPDDFADTKQEIADFEKWMDNFYNKNPKATISEMSRARVDFWIDNNCKEALRRYADYVAGNIDEETKRLIEMVKKETEVKVKQDTPKLDISDIDLEVVNKMAHTLMTNEKYGGVVSLTEDYLKKYPGELDLWIHQSVAYYHLGDCINASASIYNALIRIPKGDETNLTEMIEGISYSIKNDICNEEQYLNIRTATERKSQEDCLEKYLLQMKYLDNETLFEKFTFDKYKTIYTEPEILSDLDLDFSKTARYFRTNIGYQLEEGVNFDGKYTIVGVGFTGLGGGDWIVDRTNGKAYEFPYIGINIQYEKDSNLIILNSKSFIKNLTYSEEDKQYNCWPEIRGWQTIMVYEVVPQYFLWENNQLKYLGPKEFNPLTNLFWENYFKNKF